MAYNVKFLQGNAAAYASIALKDANTFYYTTDDKQLYLGDIKLSNAGDITALEARVLANEGSISGLTDALAILNGADDVDGSVKKQIKDAIEAITASGVAVADDAGNFTSDNVEGALAELVGKINDMGTAGAVAVETSPTTDGALKSYIFKQNGSTITTIDIPKDLVAVSGSVVEDPDGKDPGTYIELTIANGDPIYINVGSLIEYVTGGTTDEIAITVDPTTHEVTATIVAVNGSKIVDGSIAKAKLDTSVQASLDAADAAAGLVDTERQRAEAAEAQVLADAKKYTDDQLAGVDLSGIATNAAAIQELNGKMTTAESEIDQLQLDVVAAQGDATQALADAAAASTAATNAEANAKAYTDEALTWGSFGA